MRMARPPHRRAETADHAHRQPVGADDRDVPGLYFGTSTGQVFASPDEGESWSEIASYLPPIWSVEVGPRPWGVAISPDGKTVYTANGPSNDVSVVDVASRTVTARIPVGSGPWGIALRP